MRIVAGRWRGRRLKPPPGTSVRPTADRVREAWMSIVHPWLADARVLDLFAGSGALGLEALSRGAAVAEFVESSPRSLAAIAENVRLLGAGDQVRIHRGDAIKFVASLDAGAFDVAFADPPYGQGLAARVAERWLDVPFAAILGVEHAARDAMPAGGEARRYGDTVVTIFRAGEQVFP